MTSYFNPARYRSRLRNYRAFRQHLKLPLLTITLEFGLPELEDGDADILVRCSEGDVMWQKERLLNQACHHLPAECKKVVWLDCDVVFPDPDWPTRVSEALDREQVVQPFSRVYRCWPEELPAVLEGPLDPQHRVEEGSVFLHLRGLSPPACAQSGLTGRRRSSPGIAWATQRDFIAEVGFFDAMIAGSGDVAFYSGVSGDDRPMTQRARPPAVLELWQEWRSQARSRAKGRLGYLDTWVIDLWHGDHAHRGYHTRGEILIRHGFDPRTDLRLSEQGTWLWASDKPGMHRALRQYFASRREDEQSPHDPESCSSHREVSVGSSSASGPSSQA